MNEDKYLLTIQEFKSWLESKDEDEVVGKARHICHCPLSLFLQKKIKNSDSYVGIFSTYLKESEVRTIEYDNPQWVISFINLLDGKFKIRDVTAKQALNVLMEVIDLLKISG
jgi:hypothetical protein